MMRNVCRVSNGELKSGHVEDAQWRWIIESPFRALEDKTVCSVRVMRMVVVARNGANADGGVRESSGA